MILKHSDVEFLRVYEIKISVIDERSRVVFGRYTRWRKFRYLISAAMMAQISGNVFRVVFFFFIYFRRWCAPLLIYYKSCYEIDKYTYTCKRYEFSN